VRGPLPVYGGSKAFTIPHIDSAPQNVGISHQV
jgi:hypothetical protein